MDVISASLSLGMRTPMMGLSLRTKSVTILKTAILFVYAGLHWKDENGKTPGHDHSVKSLSIFFDFDPEMNLPPNLVWERQKKTRPIAIKSDRKVLDLCKEAGRVLNDYCVEVGLPEFSMFVNVAWNGNTNPRSMRKLWSASILVTVTRCLSMPIWYK